MELGALNEMIIFIGKTKANMDLVQKNKLMLFPRLNKWIVIIFIIAVAGGGFRGYQLYKYIFEPNINIPGSIIFHFMLLMSK